MVFSHLKKYITFFLGSFLSIVVRIEFLFEVIGYSILTTNQKSLSFKSQVVETNLNQMFHYTRCITPKRVTSKAHLHVIAPRQHSFFRRNVAVAASRWQYCPIWPARDLNLRPPAPETKALPLDQLAGKS